MDIPIFRAVPSTILRALEILTVFKSGNFIIAISSNWALVTEPTIILFGSEEPLPNGTLAAFASNTDAGGVLRRNV